MEVVTALGGEPVALARSETFIPVDTEALDPETRGMLAGWCREHGLDAVISTDGDADRPMVADATGRVVPGDVLGALTARSLGAKVVCTPVSSNSLISEMPEFDTVTLTRIGSPFVIAAMEAALADDPAGALAPLMTRDCLLPILAPLAAAKAAGQGLAELAAGLPPRFTAADRVAGIPTETSKAFIARLTEDRAARTHFFTGTGDETGFDTTDGLRVSFEGGRVVHLRPSGNAPECRCYAEAETAEAAQALVASHLDKLTRAL